MPDAPFEIAIPVRLYVTVNGFSVAKVIVASIVVVGCFTFFGGLPLRCPITVHLSLDPERGVHHVVGYRTLRQRAVKLAGERHLERVQVLVVVMVIEVMVVVVVVVEPERVGLSERWRWSNWLLLGGFRRTPVHVVIGRRSYYGI